MNVLILLTLFFLQSAWAFMISPHQRRIIVLDRHPSSYLHATKETLLTPRDDGQNQNCCQFCSSQFSSRNALFRHVRNNEYCASQANGGKDVSPYCLKNCNVALSIAYDAFLTTDEERKIRNDCDAKVIGDIMKSAFLHSLGTLYKEEMSTSNDDEDLTPMIVSSTQTSVASHRHYSLAQENGIGSVGEVMAMSYTYPIRKTLKDEKKGFRDREEERALREIVPLVQEYLKHLDIELWKDVLIGSQIEEVQLLLARIIPADAKIHIEMSCTQRAYHYILPLRWLQGGEEVERWWLDNRNAAVQSGDDNAMMFGVGGEMRAKKKPPNDTLIKLKAALRSAECKRVTRESGNPLASGRYGVLALKPRKAWHNFANPELKGDASPSNKPVWRVLDRCRIFQFVPFNNGNDTQVMAVIEFRGDDFVLEQVRRIVGSAVAITNGWLPDDFIDRATNSDTFIETPLSPPNHMYFADARFHFDELIQGKRLFEDVEDLGKNSMQVMGEIQHSILKRISAPFIRNENAEWLSSLENTISLRIQEQLKSTEVSLAQTKEAPPVYTRTLLSLRDIIACGRWPTTSVARSRVIRSEDCSTSKNKNDVIESGSFTIINPNFNDGALMNNENIRIPLGNQLFPELVAAIFDLEASLSNDTDSGVHQRPSSSHCAVNRNAQFTPHVDSGRGAGQSLSMIVGLGDYSGGELFIEGEPAEIGYLPTEFDGWKCRHWTAPYNGERYSLVWFTPDM